MRAAIYGAGSLGTILGAYITSKGGDIDLINHNVKHVQALNEKGAKIVGTVDFVQKVNAITDRQMTGKYDIIFLMTKQQGNSETVPFLKDYLENDGVIVTLQNGLPEHQIADVVGEKLVIGCTVAWGATMLGPGVCELTSSPDSLTFSLGTIFSETPNHMEEVVSLLKMMGSVEIDRNFIGTRWSKLLINSAFSGMSAVLGCTFGEAAAKKDSRRVVQSLMKECIDVCHASGIKIEPVQGKDIVRLFDYHNPVKKALAFMLIPLAIRKHANLKASMLQDLEKGKKTEVDSINGSVSQQGRRVGVPTPCNDKVVEIVHRIEAGELLPGRENLSLFKA